MSKAIEPFAGEWPSSVVRWAQCLDCGKVSTWRAMVVDTSDPDRPGFLCMACLHRRPVRDRSEMNL